MKRMSKIFSVFLALAILLSTSAAYATEFIFDETNENFISKEQSEQLDTVVKNYRDSYDFGIYYYAANDVNGDIVSFSNDYYVKYCNNDKDGILLAVTDAYYYVYCNGLARELFPDTDAVWQAFGSCDTYYDGAVSYINFVGAQVAKYYASLPYEELPDDMLESQPLDDTVDPGVSEVGNSTPELADNTLRSDGSLVYDAYDLLNESDEAALEKKLSDISDKHNMDIAVVIVNALDGKSPMTFADDYYDYNGYGRNDTKDGAVLLLSMQDRDWHFSTSGKAIEAFNDSSQKYIFEKNVIGYFGNDDWTGGFDCYADQCDKCISAFENGNKYPPFSFTDFLPYLLVSVAIAVVAAVLFGKAVKKRHKTVVKKAEANDYFVQGSLQVTQSYDTFAYKNVVRTRRSDDSDSKGGSSTHTSSSGSTHGGSGGKF